MKLIALYTESHALLKDRYFLPTMPPGLEPTVTLTKHPTAGDFGTQDFYHCLHQKVVTIRDFFRNNPGEPLVFADVDIVFLQPIHDELVRLLDETGMDLLFQREGYMTSDINFGFFVGHSNERTRDFFDTLAVRMVEYGDDDQKTANLMLGQPGDLRWGYLPWTYSANSHGFPPPDDAVLFHANDTSGPHSVRQKIERFEDLRTIRKYGVPAKLWWKVKSKLRRTFTSSK